MLFNKNAAFPQFDEMFKFVCFVNEIELKEKKKKKFLIDDRSTTCHSLIY